MFWKKRIFCSVVMLACVLMMGFIGNAWKGTVELNGEESPIEVTFLANEGVLISTHEKKILIDALFDDPNPNYAAPPKDIFLFLKSGETRTFC